MTSVDVDVEHSGCDGDEDGDESNVDLAMVSESNATDDDDEGD